MENIILTLQALPTGIFSFLLLLGLLVFVHELGHFAVAKYYGVRVETFSLGFGKKIFQKKHGDTTYCISLIPLGGYVKMFGDDPTKELPESEKPYAFLHKPIWPRIAIVLAGPMMNLIFAVFLFFCLGFFGETVPGTQIGDIKESSAAYAAGFRSGDKIVSVNGEAVRQWKDVKERIETNAEQELSFAVERDGETVEFKAVPKTGPNPFIFSTRSEIGIIEGLDLESRASVVGVSDIESPASKAGFGPLELIESIQGEKVTNWRDIEPLLQKNVSQLSEGEALKFTVRSIQDSPSRKENSSREISIALPKSNSSQPVMAQLGLLDPQTFFAFVKKGSPGLSITAAVNESPAAAAGLQSGDHVVAINGVPTTVWEDVLNAVKNYDESTNGIKITYRRQGKETTATVIPELTEIPNAQGGLDKRYAIGVSPALLTAMPAIIKHQMGFGSSIAYGFSQSWEYTKLIAMSLVRLVQAEVSPRNIGGVFTIGRVASQSFQAGWDVFVKTMAVISINLFLLNLLPVPVLDGGHLVFFTIEAIRGAPLSLRKLEIAQQVGLVLLLSLMAFALFNDLTHWISSW